MSLTLANQTVPGTMLGNQTGGSSPTPTPQPVPPTPDAKPDINNGGQMTTAEKLYISAEAILGTLVLVLLTLVIIKQRPCCKKSNESVEEQYLASNTDEKMVLNSSTVVGQTVPDD